LRFFWDSFHVFSCNFYIFSVKSVHTFVLIFSCETLTSKQIWRKSTNQGAARFKIATTKNQINCARTLRGKNLFIFTEKTVEVERKKMSTVTESVNTSRKKVRVYAPLVMAHSIWTLVPLFKWKNTSDTDPHYLPLL